MASSTLATLAILCVFCNRTVLLCYANYVLADIAIYLCASCACFNGLKYGYFVKFVFHFN